MTTDLRFNDAVERALRAIVPAVEALGDAALLESVLTRLAVVHRVGRDVPPDDRIRGGAVLLRAGAASAVVAELGQVLDAVGRALDGRIAMLRHHGRQVTAAAQALAEGASIPTDVTATHTPADA